MNRSLRLFALLLCTAALLGNEECTDPDSTTGEDPGDIDNPDDIDDLY